MLKPLLSKTSSRLAFGGRAWHGVSGNSVGDEVTSPGSQIETNQAAATRNPIIGFLGAKGGVGATTLAVNVGASIARDFAPVTIIDANLQQPDAAVVLGKSSDFTLMELIERANELTPEIVQACSVPVSSLIQSCRLVSPPPDGEAAIKMQLSELAGCLLEYRSCSPVWLIDLPKHLDRHLVTMLDSCDLIVLVTEPTITSINATKRWSKVFEDLGYPSSKVCLVLNRAGGKMTVVEEQLHEFSAFEDIYLIPSAFELSERSVNRGEPVVGSHPRAPLSQSVQKLAAGLAERWSHV